MGGLGDKIAEPVSQLTGLDGLQGDSTALGAGNNLLGDKQHITGLAQCGSAILLGDFNDIILIGDQMGLDGQTLIALAVNFNDTLFTFVGCQFHKYSP